MHTLEVKGEKYQKVVILSIKGNLMGPPDSDVLHEYVSGLIEKGNKLIALDLKNVRWIDSMGLSTILRCMNIVKGASGHMHLVQLSEKYKLCSSHLN